MNEQDKHLEHVDTSGERIVVYKTSRHQPAKNLKAGKVHRYGFGTVEEDEDEDEDEEFDAEEALSNTKKKFLQPTGGFCICTSVMRDAVSRFKQQSAADDMHNVTTTIIWRNQRFKTCPNCALPIFNSDAHKRATMNLVSARRCCLSATCPSTPLLWLDGSVEM